MQASASVRALSGRVFLGSEEGSVQDLECIRKTWSRTGRVAMMQHYRLCQRMVCSCHELPTWLNLKCRYTTLLG